MFWMIEAFTCKKTWKKTLKTPSIWVMVVLLILMFATARSYGFACGDYIRADGGTVNPAHIAYIHKVHNNSEMAREMSWEYQAFIVLNNGDRILYRQSHYEGYIDDHIRELTEHLESCKNAKPE